MSAHECPHCGQELVYHDYFGKVKYADHYYLYPQSWIEKTGEIFKCKNEDCEAFDEHFYAYDADGVLHEGYPC